MKKYLSLSLVLFMLLAACQSMPQARPATKLAAEDQSVSTEPNQPDQNVSRSSTDAEGVSQPRMPVLTETHQGFEYGPDQIVIALAEGFEPHEQLAVSVMHKKQGVLITGTTTADDFGNAIIYHYVQWNETDEGAYPNGEIAFWVTGSGVVKSYKFFINHEKSVSPAPYSGCGVYPTVPVRLGMQFIAWCTDLSPENSQSPQTAYSISHGGDILLQGDNADVLSDGVGIIWLKTDPNDPTGDWDITIGGQTFQVQVSE